MCLFSEQTVAGMTSGFLRGQGREAFFSGQLIMKLPVWHFLKALGLPNKDECREEGSG